MVIRESCCATTSSTCLNVLSSRCFIAQLTSHMRWGPWGSWAKRPEGSSARYTSRPVIRLGSRPRTNPPVFPRMDLTRPARASWLRIRRMTTGLVRTLKAMSSERRTSGARKARTVIACKPTASRLLAAMSNYSSDKFVTAPYPRQRDVDPRGGRFHLANPREVGMKLEHVGIEVLDLFTAELFYRTAFGFSPRYRYVSRNSPGLRTVFLERDGVSLELLERPRDAGFLERRATAPGHLSFAVDDVDAEFARISALDFPLAKLKAPRDTGDGFREAEIRDPEGNVIELSTRIRPEPRYPIRAVIFDLDGTLLDTEDNYYEADRRLLAEHGILFSKEEKRRYIGGSNWDMMVDVRRRFALADTPEELVLRKNAIYLEVAREKTALYPKMGRLLDLVRA